MKSPSCYVDGHLLSGAPRRLLLVSTDNIRNDDLFDLFAGYPDFLADAFDDVDFVGLHRNVLARTPPCGPMEANAVRGCCC